MNASRVKPLADGKPERLYYIDWLRMLSVLGVFLVHSGNMFDMLYRPAKGAISSVGASGISASGGIYFINFLTCVRVAC
jgi:peptidoglycan/LPS O-acetylase OafA/YrhL